MMADPSKTLHGKSGALGETAKGVTSGAMDLAQTGMSGHGHPTPGEKTQKMDASLFMMTSGKSSLMQRMAQSPNPGSNKLPDMSGTTMKKTMKQTEATNLGSTMAGTNMNTLDVTKSSPFRETINRGMLTGAGLMSLPKPKIN
jgi:hypothetical protein